LLALSGNFLEALRKEKQAKWLNKAAR
jgi:hypothetical protein